MARPARVRIRSRKPCVFARLRLFGWNVRFTGTTPLGRSKWKAGKGQVPRRHRSTDGTGLRKQASTRLAGQCAVVTCHAASEAPHQGYPSATGSRSLPGPLPSRMLLARRNRDELDRSRCASRGHGTRLRFERPPPRPPTNPMRRRAADRGLATAGRRRADIGGSAPLGTTMGTSC